MSTHMLSELLFTKILMIQMGVASWIQLGGLIVLLLAGFIFHKIKINKLNHEKALVQQQYNEKAELLSYSLEREKKARDEAALANRAKSLLLVRINHEIRTPLNGILGMASLLNDTSLNGEQQEYCETIKSCGESLISVVNDILLNDILEYSKVESSKMELEKKEFSLESSVEEVLDVFAGKAAQHGVELLYNIQPNVPLQIIGDNLRLQQVLMNFVENAVKFTSSGEVMVNVSLARTFEANALELSFEISDTGLGVSQEKLKSLQTELADTNTSITAQKSLGMGLVICKKLIQLMGGTIAIESELKKGTTVKFTILTNTGTQSLRAVPNHGMDGLEGKKVLIVEDNLTHSRLLKNQLEQWKLAPQIAHSAKEALTILLQEHVDLVLTDMEMPEMDGLEMAKSIKIRWPLVPVILMTRTGELHGKQHADIITSVLNKPIRKHLLAKHVRHGLKQLNTGLGADDKHAKKLSANFSEQFPLRILVAEDNAVNLKLATKVLGKLGYKPDTAQNGQEVLEIVSNKNYDLILMDVQMPQMDGLEASRMIRLCLSVQPVIIAMTANTLQGDREDCFGAGMDDYISKPINLDELVNILEKWAFHIKEKK